MENAVSFWSCTGVNFYLAKAEKGCTNFLAKNWDFFSAGDGTWFVQGENDQWEELSQDTATEGKQP